MNLTIEKCSRELESEAVNLVTLSFTDDPGIVFFSPDPVKRAYHTWRLVKALSHILDKFGEKYVIRDNGRIIAVAMWIPPGRQMSVVSLIMAGFLFIPFILGFKVFNRIMKFIDFTWKLQEDHMEGRDHWHLFYVAVHPSYRRKGYGTHIISNVMERAQTEKKPVFVQTFKEDSVKFFDSLDFKLVSRTIFSDDCIMRCMIRDFNAPLDKPKSAVKTREKNDGKKPQKSKGQAAPVKKSQTVPKLKKTKKT